MDLDSETVLTALRSGDTDRVNDVLDRVEDAEPETKARLLSACFGDCRKVYEEADDGYVRQSVVRFFSSVDPQLATANVGGTAELEPDELNLTEETDDYRDALVEFYLTALRDDDGRVRNAVKREITPLSMRFEMLGEQTRLEALHSRLDDLADDIADEKRDHVVSTREEVEAHLRPGGTGLESVFEQLADELPDADRSQDADESSDPDK